MIASLENAVPNKWAPAMERRPKFQGILKKLITYKLLCLVAAYVDVLENKATFSLIFENDFLMPCSRKFIISLGRFKYRRVRLY